MVLVYKREEKQRRKSHKEKVYDEENDVQVPSICVFVSCLCHSLLPSLMILLCNNDDNNDLV